MLKVEGLCAGYKNKKQITEVIDGLSFEIEDGDSAAVLGPSGCGKSTLINVLAGNISANSGRVLYSNGEREEQLSPMRHRIGLIPQNYGLLPWRTIRDNCLLPVSIHTSVSLRRLKLEGKGLIDRGELRIYEALGITELLDKYPSQLSGGQLQRAAIARAFIYKPDLLLMDEPFSALDVINRDEAGRLFLSVWKMSRPETLLVTHSIREAMFLGRMIIVMGTDRGRIKGIIRNPYFGSSEVSDNGFLELEERLTKMLRSSADHQEVYGT